MGLIWQIIKIQLMSQISLTHCPELVLLAKEGEDPALIATLSPEDLLLRWINHHLEKSGSDRRVANFGSDFQVFHQLNRLYFFRILNVLESS